MHRRGKWHFLAAYGCCDAFASTRIPSGSIRQTYSSRANCFDDIERFETWKIQHIGEIANSNKNVPRALMAGAGNPFPPDSKWVKHQSQLW
jgi:hypothetical protein